MNDEFHDDGLKLGDGRRVVQDQLSLSRRTERCHGSGVMPARGSSRLGSRSRARASVEDSGIA